MGARLMVTELDLHAFVDGELTDLERARVLKATAKSVALRTQLTALQELKNLVRISYRSVKDKQISELKVVN